MSVSEDVLVLFNSLPYPSILVSRDLQKPIVVAINPSFSKLTVTFSTPLVGIAFDELETEIKGFDRSRLALTQVFSQKEPSSKEIKLGFGLVEQNFRVDTYPIFDVTGEIDYVVQSFLELPSATDGSQNESINRNHDLFNFSPMPMWVYDVRTLEILDANEAACRDYGYTMKEFVGSKAWILVPTGYQPERIKELTERAQLGLPNKVKVKHQTKSGKVIDVEVTSQSLPTWSEDARIIVALDITEKLRATQAERLFHTANELERNILELHSKSHVATVDVLSDYLMGLEQLLPEISMTIMQVRNNRIYSWCVPNLPPLLSKAFDGVEIGPFVGSCGTAAFLKERVIVADILESRPWENFREITSREGFRACWSYPIYDSNGEVMATFALYKKKPLLPSEQEEQLIERAISLLTVILENRQFAVMISESTELMKQGQSLARFGNWSWEIPDNIVTWSDELFEIYGMAKKDFKATFEAYQSLLHVDDRERTKSIILNVLQTKADTEFEERIVRPTGEIRHLRSWATLKTDEHGMPSKMIGSCLDITESKKILQELSFKEARLQNLVDAQTNYVMRIDAFGAYTYYNQKFQQDFGWIYSATNFTGADSTLAVVPEHRKKMMNATLKCMENPGQLIEIELVQPGKHGQLKTSFWHMVALHEKGEALPEIQCIGIDITEKVLAQKALAQSEIRFKKLIQEGSDLISIFDSDGNFKYLSPTAEKALGLSMNELIGKNAYDFIHEDDREKVVAAFKHLEHEKRIKMAPFRMYSSDNKVRWVETIATDLTDDKAVGGIVANARDVTQRVMNELVNKEHLERYNAVAKATSDTIWDYNLLTEEIAWNHGIKNVFGYDDLFTTSGWWYDHVHPEDLNKVLSLIEQSKAQKSPRWSSEYRFRCADGDYKFVFDRAFLVFDKEGHPIRMIGAMQDITDRVKYIREIEQHNDRLKDIAWIQSHVVRGPLTRIMGLIPIFTDPSLDDEAKLLTLEYLRKSAEELDQAIKEIVNKVQ